MGGRKQCGSIKQLPGRNLIEAVTGERGKYPVGIPSFMIDKAIEIMKGALTPDELVLLRMSFGLKTERLEQKEIEGLLGRSFSSNEITAFKKAAIAKLKRWPTKNRLLSLVISIEELMQIADTLIGENQTREAEELEDLRKASVLSERVRALEEENAKLISRVEQLDRELKAELKRSEVLNDAFDRLVDGQAKFGAAVASLEIEVTRQLAEAETQIDKTRLAKSS